MNLPTAPLALRSPMSGTKAWLNSCLRPMRKVEYAMAKPTMAYTAQGCSVQWNMA